jgi:hypothetical protein
MDIIKPVTVTNSILTSSNVAENDYSEWASGTTYADGDNVIVIGTTHKVYESLVGSNVGNDPTTDDGTNWLELSATNRWKAFDQKIAAQVSNLNTIEYQFNDANSNITAVSFFGLNGNSVNVTVTDSTDGEVYNEDFSLLDNSEIVDLFTYFFAEQGLKTEALFTGIPPYLNSDVEVTITADTGTNAKVGQIVFGFLSNFGLTTYGTSVGIEDYSRKETDAFGNFIITERAFAKLVDYDVRLETGKARTVQNTLANFRATPLVYIGSEDEAFATIVYGFYRRFDITLEGPAYSFAAIEVEGLT